MHEVSFVSAFLTLLLAFWLQGAHAQEASDQAKDASELKKADAPSTTVGSSNRGLPLTPPAVSNAQIEQTLSATEQEKLSPFFQRVLAQERGGRGARDPAEQREQRLQSAPGVEVTRDGAVRYSAIVRTENASALEGSGVRVNSRYDGFATVRTEVAELAQIASGPAVSYVARGSVNYATNNEGVVRTGAALLHDGYIENTEYKGEGAIVCVYDTGIDIDHGDFRDEEGQTRLLSLWDQTISPQSGESTPEGFDFGVEYSEADINASIGESSSGPVRQEDTNGHGTHVAGTAVGDGSAYNGVYEGMAPEADLVVVKGGNETFGEAEMVDGLTYCDRAAEKAGKPVVVNFSIGGHGGPHDGTRLYEQAIDQFGTGGNSDSRAGRAVAVSAGNEGGDPIHVGKSIPAGESATIEVDVPAGYGPDDGSRDRFYLDGWVKNTLDIEATVISPPVYDTDDDMEPDSSVSYTRSPGSNGRAPADEAGTIYLFNAQNEGVGTNDLNVGFQIFDDGPAGIPPASGTWKLRLKNTSDSDAQFDGWLSFRSDKLGNTALADGDAQSTVGMPATSEEAVTTGAIFSRRTWPVFDSRTFGFFNERPVGTIAGFSSRGPTRDERIKPDITAPGQAVVSSLSQNALSENNSGVVNGEKHWMLKGTSMAAPHVAGGLALILGAFPDKTTGELQDLLKETTDQDAFTGSMRNNIWGSGKLNIFRAMVREQGGPTAERDRYKYTVDPDAPGNEDVANFFFRLNGEQRYAMQFTPRQSGLFAGFEIETASQNSDRPGVDGEGDLVYALYSDDGGVPGEALTDTLHKPLAQIAPATNTRFSMIEQSPEQIAVENLRVDQERNYHIVFFKEQPDDIVQIAGGDARTGEEVRTAVFTPQQGQSASSTAADAAQPEGTWQESDAFYGNPRAFEVASTVVRSEGVGALPVELANFSAKPDGKTAVLRWHTLNETNNDRFEVRRRVDGAFETIRAVPSNVEGGTTSTPQPYSVRVADLPPGRHRFQLRQVDADGTPTVLGVQAVQIGVAGSHELSGAYPNPFRRRARFDLSAAEGQDVRVAVYDALGRRVETLHDGELAPQKQHTFTVGADGLSSGLYFVRVNGEDFSDHVSVTLVR